MADFQLSWEAPEYEYHEKSPSWYWASIIVAAAVIAFSIWQRNFLLGIFIVIAEVLFITWGNRIPRKFSFTMTTDMISIAGEKPVSYSIKEFDSMSIDPYGDGWAEVVFVFKAKFKSPFKFLLPEDRLADMRLNLRPLLREIPYEPTIFDSIEKLIRF